MGISVKQGCLLLQSFPPGLQEANNARQLQSPDSHISYSNQGLTQEIFLRGWVRRASFALLGFLPSSPPAPVTFLARAIQVCIKQWQYIAVHTIHAYI